MKKFGAHYFVAGLALISVAGCALEDIKIKPVFRNATAERTANWQTIYDIGKERLSAGYYGLALQKFRIAFAKNPKSIDVMNALAVTYDRLGRAELAQIYYAKALDVEPDSVQTLNNLGYSNLMQEQYSEAIAYFDRALSRNPSAGMRTVVSANRRSAHEKMRLASTDSEKIIPAMAYVAEKIQRRHCIQPGSAQIQTTSKRVHTLITSNDSVRTDGEKQATKDPHQCVDGIAKRKHFLVSDTARLPIIRPSKRDMRHPVPPKAAPRIAVLQETLPLVAQPELSAKVSLLETVETQESSKSTKDVPAPASTDDVSKDSRRAGRVDQIGAPAVTAASEPWEEIVVAEKSLPPISGFDLGESVETEQVSSSINTDDPTLDRRPDHFAAEELKSDRAEMEHLNLAADQTVKMASIPALRSDGPGQLKKSDSANAVTNVTLAAERVTDESGLGDETILNLAFSDMNLPTAENVRDAVSDSEPWDYQMVTLKAGTNVATTPDRPELRHVVLASHSGGPVLLALREPVESASKFVAADTPITFNVEISNGAGRRNLAARISEYFKSRELPVSYLTNADRFDHQKTVIFYKPGMGIPAKLFAKKLPIDVEIREMSDQYSDLRILLGGDILMFDRDELYLAGIGAPNA